MRSKYDYDALTDRQTRAVYSDGYEVRYAYEAITGQLISAKEYRDGKLIRTTSLLYDPVTGRPAQVAKAEGILNYQYHAEGQLARVAETGGMTGVEYEYFYDDAGRLKTVQTPSGKTEYAYYDYGSRKSMTLPNGVKTTYTYDALLRLDSMEHRNRQNEVIAAFDYSVGRTGKRLGVVEMIGGVTAEWAYVYDGLDRLQEAVRTTSGSSTTESFEYDLVGNRMKRSYGAVETTYAYNALDQLESETTGGVATTYTYDANGNLASKTASGQATNYVYDARNRLRQVYQGAIAPANLQLEYAYDYASSRFAKVEREGSTLLKQTNFLIDSNNLTGYTQAFLEINHNTAQIKRRYEYGDDLTAQVAYSASPLSPSFFLYDGLGSTRALTDSTGNITQAYNYQPFGEGIDQPQQLSTNHLFTGEYYDENLDYYYLRARYYAAGIGRFTAFDPVEDGNNKLHKYLYCGNDGINYVDPSGQFNGSIIELPIVNSIVSFLANNYARIVLFGALGAGSHVIRNIEAIKESGGLLTYIRNNWVNLLFDIGISILYGLGVGGISTMLDGLAGLIGSALRIVFIGTFSFMINSLDKAFYRFNFHNEFMTREDMIREITSAVLIDVIWTALFGGKIPIRGRLLIDADKAIKDAASSGLGIGSTLKSRQVLLEAAQRKTNKHIGEAGIEVSEKAITDLLANLSNRMWILSKNMDSYPYELYEFLHKRPESIIDYHRAIYGYIPDEYGD